MSPAELLAFFAAIGTTGAFIPQAIKVYKTKKTDDLSIGTFSFFSTGVLLWTIYGYVINSIPIVLGNGITFLLAIYILGVIIKGKRKHK